MSRLKIFWVPPGPPKKTDGFNYDAKSAFERRSSAGVQMHFNDEAASNVFYPQCKRTWREPRTTGHLSSCGQKEEDIYIYIVFKVDLDVASSQILCLARQTKQTITIDCTGLGGHDLGRFRGVWHLHTDRQAWTKCIWPISCPTSVHSLTHERGQEHREAHPAWFDQPGAEEELRRKQQAARCMQNCQL